MLVEGFTSETLLRVQLDWKCLISKKKKKKVQRIFFLLLKILNSGSVTPRGNEGGKRKTFWRRELGFCIHLNGIFQSACNMISHEHCTQFTLKFQGGLKSPFKFGRSSAGSARCRLVWKAGNQRGEIKPTPPTLCPVTLSCWHRGLGGLQPLLLHSGVGCGSCLDPPSNTPT